MATQLTAKLKRIWGSSDTDAIRALVEEMAGKIRFGEVSINAGNLVAGAEADVAVTLPAGTFGTVASGALVFVQPPAALEAGIYLRRWWISAANQLTVTLRNETGGAVDPAAATFTVLVLQNKKASVL